MVSQHAQWFPLCLGSSQGMDSMDIDDELPCVSDLQTFLEEIREETVKNELVRYLKSCDTTNLHHQPAPERRWDGTRAVPGVWDDLNFLCNRLHSYEPSSGLPSKQCRFSPTQNVNSSTVSSHPCFG